jgi:hypothetical protein
MAEFKDYDTAQEAKDTLEKEKIGEAQRWVNLFDCESHFFKKAVGWIEDDN